MLSASDAYTEIFRFCRHLQSVSGAAAIQVVAVSDAELLIVFSMNDAEEDAKTPPDPRVSVCAEAARTGLPIFVPDVRKRENYWPLAGAKVLWEYCHPLTANGKVYALVNIEGLHPVTGEAIAALVEREIDTASPGILLAIAASAAVRFRNKSSDDDVAEMEEMLKNEVHGVNKSLFPSGLQLDKIELKLALIRDRIRDAVADRELGQVAADIRATAVAIRSAQARIDHWRHRYLVRDAMVYDCGLELREAVDLAREQAGHQGTAAFFTIEVEADIPAFRCYNLREILGNLIINSLEAMSSMPGPHQILLSAETRSANGARAVPEVSIIVRDTGPGFDRVILDREPFSRTSTRGADRGVGLRFAESRLKRTGVGASIRLRNRSDSRGAEVEIVVPVVPKSPGPAAGASGGAAGAPFRAWHKAGTD